MQEKKNFKPYLIASWAFLSLFLLGLVFGRLGGNPKSVLGGLVLAALLFFSFRNVSAVFLGIIFSLPLLIGADNFQFNLASFVRSFIELPDLYVNPFSLACLFLLGLAFFEIIKKRQAVFNVPLFWIIFASILSSLFIFLKSQYLAPGAVFELYFLTAFSAFFLGYFLLGSGKKYVALLHVIFFSSLFPALWGFFQLFSGNFLFENDSSLGRIAGTFPHSNTFGSFLFLILSIGIFLFLSFQKTNKDKVGYFLGKRIFLIFLASLFILLIGTYSRTAWIALLLTALFLFFLRPVLRWPIFFGFAFFLSLGVFWGKVRERLTGLFEHSMFDSMYGRKEIWDMALFAARKKPWNGYGMGSFEAVIQNVQGKETGNVYPHNDLIRFALEGGVLGVLTYAFYMLGALYWAVRSFMEYPQKYERMTLGNFETKWDIKLLGALPVLFFGVMLVISLVEAPSMDFVFQIITWTVLGSWLGITQKEKILIQKNK